MPGSNGSRARCWRRPGISARGRSQTFRRIILPLALPAVVAGSIFTFSLTLGDYIAPSLITSTQFLGNVIADQLGAGGDLPLAAALACLPVVIMLLPLRGAPPRRVRSALSARVASR